MCNHKVYKQAHHTLIFITMKTSNPSNLPLTSTHETWGIFLQWHKRKEAVRTPKAPHDLRTVTKHQIIHIKINDRH
jgi:hypothetical protein